MRNSRKSLAYALQPSQRTTNACSREGQPKYPPHRHEACTFCISRRCLKHHFYRVCYLSLFSTPAIVCYFLTTCTNHPVPLPLLLQQSTSTQAIVIYSMFFSDFSCINTLDNITVYSKRMLMLCFTRNAFPPHLSTARQLSLPSLFQNPHIVIAFRD